MNARSMSPYDHVRNAAVRLRAIRRNRPLNETDTEQRELDDRVMTAEVELEKALIEAEMMTEEDAIESIIIEGTWMKVALDSGATRTVLLSEPAN